MKVLVTGATGFIGNYVIEELLKRNCIVIAVSLNESDALLKPWYNKVTNISFDIANITKKDLFTFFNKPDVLIHLAWGGLPNYKSDIHILENLPAHKSFIENIVSNGLKSLTVAGTCFEYGMQEGCLGEDMPALPDNYYAIAKNELRKYIEVLQTKYSFSYKWVRLFYMYGEGQNPKSLIPLLDAALERGDEMFNMSGGEQVRDFLPVNEVGENIVKVALQDRISGVINISSNNPITVKDFVEDYMKKHNKKIKLNLGYYPYPDYEPMRFWGDNEKLKAIK